MPTVVDGLPMHVTSFVDLAFGAPDRAAIRRLMGTVFPANLPNSAQEIYTRVLSSWMEEAMYLPGFTTLQEMLIERACMAFAIMKSQDMDPNGRTSYEDYNATMLSFKRMASELSNLKEKADNNASFKMAYIGLVGTVLVDVCMEYFDSPQAARGFLVLVATRLAALQGDLT